MADGTTVEAPVVVLDSRKFLSALNDSAQSRIKFFEDKVAEMGRAANKHLKLAGLRFKQLNKDQQWSGDMFIEDVDTHDYFVADHRREKGGKICIENVRPIDIVEEEKQELFEQTCLQLIDALEANDQKAMGTAFGKMTAQRFSPRAVPPSGLVRTKDGQIRHVKIADGRAIGEGVRNRLVAAIVESLRDRVIVENGQIVSGHFNDGEEIELPITKWGVRKLCAKQMREAAEKAYLSAGFQDRMHALACAIYEDKIKEAVTDLTPFIKEHEEFTLLNRNQAKRLIENALAAKAVFNQQLCDHVATLFHRTNLKLNRETIIREWRGIAAKVEHPTLMENVHILESSKNFEEAYDKFLELLFEAISNREVTASALATTLDVLRNKTPKIKESHELSSKLGDLINRLREPDFDDAAIYEAEDLIATIQEELAANESLSDFDALPGSSTPDMGTLGQSLPTGGGAGGTPVININSPLISINSSNSASGKPAGGGDELSELGGDTPPAAPPGGPAGPGGAGGAGGGLNNLLGQGAGGGMGGQPGLGEGVERNGAVGEEWEKPWLKKDKDGEGDEKDGKKESKKPWEDDDDCETCDESVDPYAFAGVRRQMNMSDYGAPIITDSADLAKVVNLMRSLVEEHQLTGVELKEHLRDLAQAGIEAAGLRIPSGKFGLAVEQAVATFLECDDSCSSEPHDHEDDEEEGVAEDQHHHPRIPPRGLKKASINPTWDKKSSGGGSSDSSDSETVDESYRRGVLSDGIAWIEKQQDGLLGEYAGVRFILDHGGDSGMEPVVLSEDGQVEEPIPAELQESALAAAELVDGDPTPFLSWLGQSIEQFRPISEEEDEAIHEAVAAITANADGTITVNVDSDVEVQRNGEGGEMGGGGEMEMGGEPEGDGMAPVDSVSTEPQPPAESGGGEMPDFEQDGMSAGEPEPAPSAGAPEPSGTPSAEAPAPAAEQPRRAAPKPPAPDGMVEDEDITEPQSSKYTETVRGRAGLADKRQMPTAKIATRHSEEGLKKIGPDLKTDDGTGTNPPVARKTSDD